MRKILFILLIILLLIGSGFIIVKGYHIGNFTVWGVKDIKNANATIDDKNSKLSDLVSTTYQNSVAELNVSADTLNFTKNDYEDKASVVPNSGSYMQTEEYEIEFLFTRLGNHAKDKNVKIKINLVNSSTDGRYDLQFIIAGTYEKVTDFIYAIENDTKLGFKIEDFHMSAAEGGVQGTFTCKEIGVNIQTLEQSTGDTTNTEENSNEIQEGTQNNTDNTNNNESSAEGVAPISENAANTDTNATQDSENYNVSAQ